MCKSMAYPCWMQYVPCRYGTWFLFWDYVSSACLLLSNCLHCIHDRIVIYARLHYLTSNWWLYLGNSPCHYMRLKLVIGFQHRLVHLLFWLVSQAISLSWHLFEQFVTWHKTTTMERHHGVCHNGKYIVFHYYKKSHLMLSSMPFLLEWNSFHLK